MPPWARFGAAGLGHILLPLGVITLVTVGALDWKLIGLGVGATCAGLDLLSGAVSGKWPVSLQWLV